jgi:hypothetical protein
MPGTAGKIVIALVFVGAMLYATFGMGGIDCEACLTYQGRSACRTVTAPDRDQAIAQVTATICSVVASGVTQSMECNRTPPASLRCTE